MCGFKNFISHLVLLKILPQSNNHYSLKPDILFCVLNVKSLFSQLVIYIFRAFKMRSVIILLSILLITVLIVNIKGEQLFLENKEKRKTVSKQAKYLSKLKELDKYYSSKELGITVAGGKTTFRLFAPQAVSVYLFTFKEVEDEFGNSFEMKIDLDGVWEITLDGELYGMFYGFKVLATKKEKLKDKPLCIDPYSKAVASFTDYANPRKSIIYKDDYDWEGDEWIKRDWRDLVIYEMHIRDMTAHTSSGSTMPGTYKGLVEKGVDGGISYIKELGVNTVELLPPMDFGRIEIPYRKNFMGKFNTWNPYERNHWGYMTAAFFAPESYYSESTNHLEWNKWIGVKGEQVKDFKDMVKAFHKEGIAVIMDVVYNHLSEYEIGNLKEIDREYYFRLDGKGHYIAQSGCGNDLKTERPMVRRLIVESILYWMTEYHIDGFRFDLGKLIDWETIEEIIREAKKINPYVVFVCEPWGGGYDPAGFSLRGWGSWNDQIRNGIKGENPFHGHGWIFGKWFGNNDPQRIKSYVNGTLVRDKHGLFQKKEHSVNYLESHDGYTLGDFIRIGSGEVDHHKKIKDVDSFQLLSAEQLKLNKLAALFLMTSQGMVMIHSGQEYARTKVIPFDIDVPDTNKGRIDHNTYDKDNEVNYINYEHAKSNKELLDYYKGLIELRNKYNAFRRADYKEIEFMETKDNEFALGYSLKFENEEFILLFNANHKKKHEFELPGGNWSVLVNPYFAGTIPLDTVSGSIKLEKSTGYVLKKVK